jgi:hypothetical protein
MLWRLRLNKALFIHTVCIGGHEPSPYQASRPW